MHGGPHDPPCVRIAVYPECIPGKHCIRDRVALALVLGLTAARPVVPAQVDTPTRAGLSTRRRCQSAIIRQEMGKRIDGPETRRIFTKIVPKPQKTGRTSAGFDDSRVSRTTYCYPMSTLRRPSPPPGTDSETARTVPPVMATLPAMPVLVDASGRRQRRVRLAARVIVLCLLGYLALAGVLLLVRPGLVPLGLPGLNPTTHSPEHRAPRPSPAGKASTSGPGTVTRPVPRTEFSPTAPPRTSSAPPASPHRPTTKPTPTHVSPAKHAHGHSTRSTDQSHDQGNDQSSDQPPAHSTPHTPPGQAKKSAAPSSSSAASAHAHHKAAS